MAAGKLVAALAHLSEAGADIRRGQGGEVPQGADPQLCEHLEQGVHLGAGGPGQGGVPQRRHWVGGEEGGTGGLRHDRRGTRGEDRGEETGGDPHVGLGAAEPRHRPDEGLGHLVLRPEVPHRGLGQHETGPQDSRVGDHALHGLHHRLEGAGVPGLIPREQHQFRAGALGVAAPHPPPHSLASRRGRDHHQPAPVVHRDGTGRVRQAFRDRGNDRPVRHPHHHGAHHDTAWR